MRSFIDEEMEFERPFRRLVTGFEEDEGRFSERMVSPRREVLSW
jgi:hypothetical protein